MNRTLKFRAWDADEKQMYSPTHEAYKGRLWELFVGFSGDLCAHTMDGMEHESKWIDRYELMQYTGLKDNNDVEIYEGDIVDVMWMDEPLDSPGRHWENAEIAWWAGGFRIVEDYMEHDFSHEIMTDGRNLADIWDDPTTLRVFIKGNIYENKELLDDDNNN